MWKMSVSNLQIAKLMQLGDTAIFQIIYQNLIINDSNELFHTTTYKDFLHWKLIHLLKLEYPGKDKVPKFLKFFQILNRSLKHLPIFKAIIG